MGRHSMPVPADSSDEEAAWPPLDPSGPAEHMAGGPATSAAAGIAEPGTTAIVADTAAADTAAEAVATDCIH